MGHHKGRGQGDLSVWNPERVYHTVKYRHGIFDRAVHGAASGGMCVHGFFYVAPELYRRLSLRQQAVLLYRVKPCPVYPGIYGWPACQNARSGCAAYTGGSIGDHTGAQSHAQQEQET